MCSALGRPCPLFAPPASTMLLPHSDWPDVEQDWDGERQKEEERKRNRQDEERELEQKPITDPPSPQYRPSSEVTSVITDTLVPVSVHEDIGEQKEEVEEEKSIEKEDKDTESDYDSDNTVTILRADMSKSINLEKENIKNMKSCLCTLYIVCSSLTTNVD